MRSCRIVLGFAAWLAALAGEGSAQQRPALHEMTDFLTRGAFTDLDRDLAQHRLTLAEIEAAGLDGRPKPVDEILAAMAKYEKLKSRVEEPLEVRGEIRIALTPNTTGAEAFTTCFEALTYNGLVLSGRGDELILVRPETKPNLTPPRRLWNRTRILSTHLFRLGYLSSDPILRRYREEIGTGEGHAVIVPKANVVMVTDTDAALESLGSLIDAETLAAMGEEASAAIAAGPRPPSPGAVASRENLHFYLLAFARSRRIPLFGAQQPGTATRPYPEAAVWLSDRGYAALQQEYRRVNELIPVAQEAVAQGWVDPRPDRTLSPAAQRRIEIRFGLVSPLPGTDRARTAKKPARRKR
jgi:hypothetical protein